MSDETETTTDVARVLGEHSADVTSYDAGDLQGCMGCDWTERDWDAFYAHQAAMLAEVGLLRDQATIDALNERCRILVDEADRLRAQIATQEPAGGTQGGSGDSRTLADRLRAAADYQDRPGAYDGLRAMADEVHRLEVHARVVEQSLRTARAEGDGARIEADQWKARYEEVRDADDTCVAHGTVRPCRHCAGIEQRLP